MLLSGTRKRPGLCGVGLDLGRGPRDAVAAQMLRWLIGGGREPQGLAEKSPLQTIGEEQTQNPYTELLVLKAHRDIVRYLVRLDDSRFASAGDDGTVVVWNAQTGEKLLELNGHTQKITAIITLPCLETCEEKKSTDLDSLC